MITPTVGRVVHFFPRGHKEGDQPHAAIVCAVQGDRQITVCEFDQNGVGRPMREVQLLQDDDKPRTDEPYCAWMPYQLEKAKEQDAPKAKKTAHQPHGKQAEGDLKKLAAEDEPSTPNRKPRNKGRGFDQTEADQGKMPAEGEQPADEKPAKPKRARKTAKKHK